LEWAFASFISGSLKGTAGRRAAAGGREGRDAKEEEESMVARAGGNAAMGTAGDGAFTERERARDVKDMVMSNAKKEEGSSRVKGCRGAATDASVDVGL
jgi:hypothetical protein